MYVYLEGVVFLRNLHCIVLQVLREPFDDHCDDNAVEVHQQQNEDVSHHSVILLVLDAIEEYAEVLEKRSLAFNAGYKATTQRRHLLLLCCHSTAVRSITVSSPSTSR